MLNPISHSVGSTTLQQPHNSDQPEATMEKRYTPTPEPSSIQGRIAFFEGKIKEVTSKYTEGLSKRPMISPRTVTQHEKNQKANTHCDYKAAIHKLSLKLQAAVSSEERMDDIKLLEGHVDTLCKDKKTGCKDKKNRKPLTEIINKNNHTIRIYRNRITELTNKNKTIPRFYEEAIDKLREENRVMSIAIAATSGK